jgi:hypothetical protein
MSRLWNRPRPSGTGSLDARAGTTAHGRCLPRRTIEATSSSPTRRGARLVDMVTLLRHRGLSNSCEPRSSSVDQAGDSGLYVHGRSECASTMAATLAATWNGVRGPAVKGSNSQRKQSSSNPGRRKCAAEGCQVYLSKYNKGDRCFTHDDPRDDLLTYKHSRQP